MNIHEYQAKEVLRGFGVATPRGIIAFTADEAEAAATKLATDICVVKAQIHAGGRGKGGGVKLAKSVSETRALADDMLGMTLITHQTGAQGRKVKRVYIEEGCDIARELYLSILLDRATSRVSFIASTQGGTDIEAVAEATPDKIITISIDPATGISAHHSRQIAFALELEGAQIKQASALLGNLYRAFIEKDMSLLEINPLVVTQKGDLLCLDAKINFDDNALYRHADIVALRDEDEEDPAEIAASAFDLSYIKLDGTIGCMVNGAGLAMATMDIIKLYGAAPANFLDVGGGATADKVREAFKIILSDSNVEGILVNIFGGIMRCDVIAQGVVAAARETSLSVPLVVRLAGTNVEQGQTILAQSGLAITAANDLDDAAEKIVAAVKNK
ncbi:MAG: ADP-forming succinate--CoA ligase subunit beta [Alphaproteobacteria bacterium]|nr:ADP-forming succinate--CoA ligase subunit beta [Alphaproteobacteria bacterium]